MIRFDFSGQLVIVTGGTRGIGAAITQAFAEAGASVIATFAGNETAAAEFKAGLKTAGEQVQIEKLDAADCTAVEAFFKALADAGRTVAVLVNNAGIRRDQALAMMSIGDWDAVIRANLTGSFVMSKFAVQSMMGGRYGRIVNITSPAAHFGFQGQANYSASKAGQMGMMRSLSKEVAKRGITVNCVSPGFIDTALLADLDDKAKKDYVAMVPLKRFGTPAEVATAVLFLASKDAGYITGTTLDVAGGL